MDTESERNRWRRSEAPLSVLQSFSGFSLRFTEEADDEELETISLPTNSDLSVAEPSASGGGKFSSSCEPKNKKDMWSIYRTAVNV